MDDATLNEIVGRLSPFTDSELTAKVPAQWFLDALDKTRTTGGEMAIEIGVRRGGMSAIFCEIAQKVGRPGFLVASVDPYGDFPYYNPGMTGLTFGEDMGQEARAILAKYACSAFFRMPAQDFLGTVLPSYRWWFNGKEFPDSKRFLSFVYVDGQHDDVSVVSEVAAVASRMAPGGIIAIDNAEACPDAIKVLCKPSRFNFAGMNEWFGPAGGSFKELHRVAFEVGP